ncbi:MAG: DUF6633 family protein [Bacteroidales bacterium]
MEIPISALPAVQKTTYKTLSDYITVGKNQLTSDQLIARFDNNYLIQINQKAISMVTAFNGVTPTLGNISRTFKPDVAKQILCKWLISLSDYYGKGSMTDSQISELSSLIISEYHHIKLSEFALFLKFLKLGRYQKFFGSPDPQSITISLNMYLKDRQMEIEKYERENQSKAIQERDPDAISITEYCKIIGVPDPDTLKKLFAMEYQMYNQCEETRIQIDRAKELLEKCKNRNQKEGRVPIQLTPNVTVLAKDELVATAELREIYIKNACEKLNLKWQDGKGH